MTCSDTVPDIKNEGGSPTDAHLRQDPEVEAKNLDGKVLSEAQLLQVHLPWYRALLLQASVLGYPNLC
jgi:hypothetical protein